MSLLLLGQSLYRPPFQVAVVVLVCVLAIACIALLRRRERTRWTIALRLAGLAGLAWVLMGPSRSEQTAPRSAQPPRVNILVDTSMSMAERDGGGSAQDGPITRLQAVQQAWLIGERFEKLQKNAYVEVTAFDATQRRALPYSLDAEGKQTLLMQAINNSSADVTLILSDGHDTARRVAVAGDAARYGRLYAVPVGTTRSAPDVSIQAWPASDRLFEDQSTTLTASVRHKGMDGQRAVVELLHDGEVAERRPITLSSASQELRFKISPELETGQAVQAHHYTARVRLPDREEAYTDNNADDVFVQVSKGRIRVLMLEGEPYWDTRSLSRLIGAHPRFDLTAVSGFGDDRRTTVLGEDIEPGTKPLDAIERFDIVVLGRRVERLVDATFASRLDAYVRGGGAVVFARGQPFGLSSDAGTALLTGLESISPVAWGTPVVGDMRVRVGEQSDPRGPLADLQDQAVLSRLPGMIAATRIDGRKTASLVLLEQSRGDGPSMAALTTLRAGSGVVMAVLTEGLWRWELLPGVADDAAPAESVYAVFWVRALQWLASGGEFLPGQDISIQADRLSVEPGEPVTLRVSTRYVETRPLDLQLTVIDRAGNTRPLPLTKDRNTGSYNATYTPESAGTVRFALSAPGRDELIDPARPLTTRVAVVTRSDELRDTSAKPELLKQLTEPTGGRCLALDESEPVFDYLQELQAARGSAEVVDYDFNTLPVFLWIAGCFGIEWIIRRRTGLR